MRIAFVAARPPYPLDSGGRIRTFHLLQSVSQVHDVTLVTTAEGDRDRDALAALGEAVGKITIRAVAVGRRAAPLRRVARGIRALSGPLPYTWVTYCDPRFRNHIKWVLGERQYDLVHCDHIHVAQAVAGLDTPPRLLHAHNIESVIFRRLAEHESSLWRRPLIAWQARKTMRAEAEAHRYFDRSVVVSDVDRVELERISPGRAISVVPNGVDPAWLEPVGGVELAPTMVFAGAMDWVPNIDGVGFFVREVLPRIRQQIPDAALWVVGRTPPPSLARSWTAAGVRVTGTVLDVRPFVARARLVVVPLRIGGGTRLKILEAWAMRKAVLSSTVGAEGLPVVDGENIALADTPEAMAASAVSLLRNPNQAARLGAAGRQVVEDQFTWPRVAGRLLDAYEETVASGRRGVGGAVPHSANGEETRVRVS